MPSLYRYAPRVYAGSSYRNVGTGLEVRETGANVHMGKMLSHTRLDEVDLNIFIAGTD